MYLWTLGSRLRASVCRGRSGSEATLWGLSSAGLSALSARRCTAVSAPAPSRLPLDGKKRKEKK